VTKIRETLENNLEDYLRGWGPIQWRDQVQNSSVQFNPDLGGVLNALADIEDDAFYMRVKLRHTGALRADVINHFVAVWLAEESEHSRALAHLADLYGYQRQKREHKLLGRDKRSIAAVVGLSIGGAVYSNGMCAAYLTLGAAQEYVALTTYNALAEENNDEVTRDILRQISRQEGRHLRFYRRGAEAILEGNSVAQKFCRWVLSTYWRPPGIDLLGREEWIRLFGKLLEVPENAAKYNGMDAMLDRLPGLEGLNLMQRFTLGATHAK
jgi:hypothetical protein